MAQAPDDPGNESAAEHASPKPVTEGVGWTGMLKLLAPGAAAVALAGGLALTLTAAVPVATMGAPMSARVQWEQRQQEMLQAALEAESQQSDEVPATGSNSGQEDEL